MDCASRYRFILGPRGDTYFSCGQSPYEATPFLGLDDCGYTVSTPRRYFPRGSVHPTKNDVSIGKGRIFTILYLFTWRDTAEEMRAYVNELTTSSAREFFRPHFFVNTPDINPTFLHDSGRPGFLIRAALAALLSGLWGVYSGFRIV